MSDALKTIGVFMAGLAVIWICAHVIAAGIGAAMADPSWRF